MNVNFNTIKEAVADLAEGKLVIVVDDEDREIQLALITDYKLPITHYPSFWS